MIPLFVSMLSLKKQKLSKRYLAQFANKAAMSSLMAALLCLGIKTNAALTLSKVVFLFSMNPPFLMK